MREHTRSTPIPTAESARDSNGCWAVLVHGPSRQDFLETPSGAEIEVTHYSNYADGPRRAIVVLRDEPPFRSRITGEYAAWARFERWLDAHARAFTRLA